MKKISSALITASAYVTMASTSFAQEMIQIDPFDKNPGIPAETPVQTIFTNAINIVFTVAILLVLVYLIWGAFKWITSGGDKESLKSARSMITNALIGLGLLSLSFIILRIAGYILGIDVGNIVLPSLAQPVTGR